VSGEKRALLALLDQINSIEKMFAHYGFKLLSAAATMTSNRNFDSTGGIKYYTDYYTIYRLISSLRRPQ
jgi:hypothetical protein